MMPRLFDYVRRNPLCRGPLDLQLDDQKQRILRSALRDATVIVADNVAQYIHADTDQEYWDFDDYPNLAPPFRTFWIEYKTPKITVSREFGLTKHDFNKVGDYHGILIQAQEIDAPDCKWILLYSFFVGGRNGTAGPLGAFYLTLSDTGKPVEIKSS